MRVDGGLEVMSRVAFMLKFIIFIGQKLNNFIISKKNGKIIKEGQCRQNLKNEKANKTY
jgi:hypothetical protein